MTRHRNPFETLAKHAGRAALCWTGTAVRAGLRIETMRARALAREAAKRERAAEREKARLKRECARADQAATKEAERIAKLAAKQAQVQAWKAELDAHLARDAELLNIAAHAPDVKERDLLWNELQQPSKFEPEPFVPQALSDAERADIRQRHIARMKHDAACVDAECPATAKTQAALGGAVVTGGALMSFQDLTAGFAILTALVAVVWLLIEAVRTRRWNARKKARDAAWELALGAAVARDEAEATARREDEDRADYEKRVRAAEALHDQNEQARLAHLLSLLAGDRIAMQRELSRAFPLTLPAACAVSSYLVDIQTLSLDLTVPSADVLVQQEARLLASGRVAFKPKNKSVLRDEYARLVAGLALRHATEVMLILPTITTVLVRCSCAGIDPSTGTTARQKLLTVSYVFDGLAPLDVGRVDPVAALSQFEHEWCDRAPAKNRGGNVQ
jgi:hypothetical protein